MWIEKHKELKETCQSFLFKTDGWGDSLFNKGPPSKHKNLGWVPRTQVRGQEWLCMLIILVLEGRDKWIPGTHWPVGLAKLASPRCK